MMQLSLKNLGRSTGKMRQFCVSCGEKKPIGEFLYAHGQAVRFDGGGMAEIIIKPKRGEICTFCIELMQRMLAESKILYPENVRRAIDEKLSCQAQV